MPGKEPSDDEEQQRLDALSADLDRRQAEAERGRDRGLQDRLADERDVLEDAYDELNGSAGDETARAAGRQRAVVDREAAARMRDRAAEDRAHLEEALRSRDVIGQAKGILMHGHKITADAAFELLVDESKRRNIKLRVVAQDVVDTGSLGGPPAQPG